MTEPTDTAYEAPYEVIVIAQTLPTFAYCYEPDGFLRLPTMGELLHHANDIVAELHRAGFEIVRVRE